MDKQTKRISVSEDSGDLEGQRQTGVKGWCRNNWKFMLLCKLVFMIDLG